MCQNIVYFSNKSVFFRKLKNEFLTSVSTKFATAWLSTIFSEHWHLPSFLTGTCFCEKQSISLYLMLFVNLV